MYIIGKSYIYIYKISTCIASSTSNLSWGDGDQGVAIGLGGQLGQVHGGVQNVDDQAITSEKRSSFTLRSQDKFPQSRHYSEACESAVSLFRHSTQLFTVKLRLSRLGRQHTHVAVVAQLTVTVTVLEHLASCHTSPMLDSILNVQCSKLLVIIIYYF